MVAKNRFSRALIVELFSLYYRKPLQDNSLAFVKIILLKSDNCALRLRKRLFCAAKPTLLPCKTAAFGTQNNRFCNVLMMRWLHDSYACEKYLYIYPLLFGQKVTLVRRRNVRTKTLHFFLIISILNRYQVFL